MSAVTTLRTIVNDGWTNLLTRLGTKDDKTTHTRFRHCRKFSQAELTDIYRADGFGRRIIDLKSGEMVRKWITIEGDADNALEKPMQELQLRQKTRALIRWARLYGGALMVLGVDDGGDFEKELNEGGIRAFEFLHVFDRYLITYTQTDLYDDPKHRSFGLPEFYTITPLTGSPFRIHESRVIRMDGAELPEREFIQEQRWGESDMQAIYDQLSNLGTAFGGAANIVHDFVTGVLTVKNLANMISTDQGTEQVQKRLQILDMSRSILNTMLLDTDETYTRITSTVTGLSDLLDRFAMALSAVSGIPFTLLMGRAPTGLAAEGAATGDVRNFYDSIAVMQEDDLRAPLERIIRLQMLANEGPFKGQELKDWKLVFNPLWQMSDTEIATLRKSQAETDTMYITHNVLAPEEVALSRFGGDHYSIETEIDVKLHELPDPDEVAELEAQLPPPPPPPDPNAPNPPEGDPGADDEDLDETGDEEADDDARAA